MNPFSNDRKVEKLHKPVISKEEYGRPPKGSLSELRAVRASIQVNREMLQLCQVIHKSGERLFSKQEKPNDPRIAISFGELFIVSLKMTKQLIIKDYSHVHWVSPYSVFLKCAISYKCQIAWCLYNWMFN